jgi:hypothetical protein
MFGWVLSLVFLLRVFQKLLILLGRTQGHGGLSEEFFQVFSGLLLERFGSQLGTSLRGEDSLEGGKGEGAVATSPLQGALEILAMIGGKKPQNSAGFLFPVPSSLHQLLEEQDSFRSELREALFQQFILLLRISSGEMIGMDASLPRSTTREEFMAGDLRHLGVVDDQFFLGDADRQQFANALPGDRVEVLAIGNSPSLFTVRYTVPAVS